MSERKNSLCHILGDESGFAHCPATDTIMSAAEFHTLGCNVNCHLQQVHAKFLEQGLTDTIGAA